MYYNEKNESLVMTSDKAQFMLSKHSEFFRLT